MTVCTKNIHSVAKWREELSEPFAEKKDIRQGGASSAYKYKAGKTNCSTNLIQLTATALVI